MVRKLLFCLLFLGILVNKNSTQAQSTQILGIVNDANTNQSLPGVTIQYSRDAGIVSDPEGKFSLTVEPGIYMLSFSYIGYETQSQQVELKSGDVKILVIRLQNKAHELSAVVISASRFEQKIEEVSVSMDVLESTFIKNQATTNVENSVEQVPGVNIIDGQANIRGGSGYSYGAGSRVMILVDDIPLLAADANDPKWNVIPVEWIESIEIMKGASSALYGSSALNGVMQFRTIRASDKPITKITSSVSIYDKPDYTPAQWWSDPRFIKNLSAIHSGSIKDWKLQVGFNIYDDDGFKLGEFEKRYRITGSIFHSPAIIQGLQYGLRWNYQESESGTFLIWEDDTSGAYIPDGTFSNNSSIIPNTTKRFYIDPQIQYAKNKNLIHKLQGRYFKTDNKNETQQQSFSDWYYGEYQAHFHFHEHLKLLTGSGGSSTKVTSELYGNHSAYNAFFFAQLDGKISKLNFSLGGRLEQSGIDQSNSDPIPVVRIGLNYPIHKATYIRGSFGQGYRYPSIAERFIRTQVGSIVIYPNDSLTHEKGWTTEIGFRQLFQTRTMVAYVDMAIFRMEYNDMMEFSFGQWGNAFTDPFFGLGFKSINIGNTRIDGIDVGAGVQFNIKKVQVKYYGGITQLDPIKKDFSPETDTLSSTSNKNVLKYRYRTTVKSDLDFKHEYGFMAGLSLRYNSQMENIDKSFDSLIEGVQSYRLAHTTGDLIFDARIGFEKEDKYSILLVVKNLNNKFYAGRPADMQAPRTFTLQVNYSF